MVNRLYSRNSKFSLVNCPVVLMPSLRQTCFEITVPSILILWWTSLNKIGLGGTHDQKLGWVLYWCGVILKKLGHGSHNQKWWDNSLKVWLWWIIRLKVRLGCKSSLQTLKRLGSCKYYVYHAHQYCCGPQRKMEWSSKIWWDRGLQFKLSQSHDPAD